MQRTLRIQILDEEFEADAEDSLLRALQFYGIRRDLPDHDFKSFCWNADCHQCLVEIECQGVRGLRFACQTSPLPGMAIRSIPGILRWDRKLKSER